MIEESWEYVNPIDKGERVEQSNIKIDREIMDRRIINNEEGFFSKWWVWLIISLWGIAMIILYFY